MTDKNETATTESYCSGELKQGDMISHCPMAAKFEATIGNPKLNFNLRI